MRQGRLLIAWSIVLVASANSAPAAITAYWRHNPIGPAAIASSPVLANMQSWSLMAVTDGDWASAGLRATLPAGNSYFNHSFGGNTRPPWNNPPVLSGLAYDTYVSGPGDNGDPDDPTNNPPALLGGHPSGSTQSLSGSTFSVSWGNLTADAPGTYEIARLTFPKNVFPTIYSEGNPPSLPNSSNTSQVNPESFTFLAIIPEPAALGVLGAAALLAGRCRRR